MREVSRPWRHHVGRRSLLAAAAGAIAVPARAEAPIRANGTGCALGMLALLHDAWQPPSGPVPIDIRPPLGTGGGIAALAAGRLDLAIASRPLSGAERDLGLTAVPYARSRMVFATRRGYATSRLRLEEVAAFLAGDVTEWPDGTPVLLVRRPSTDSDTQMLAALSPAMAQAMAKLRTRPGIPIASTDLDNAAALEDRAGTLGFILLGQMLAERRRLRALVVETLPPPVAPEDDAEDVLTKTLYAVLPATPRPEAAAFAAFLAADPEAAALLRTFGHRPLRS